MFYKLLIQSSQNEVITSVISVHCLRLRFGLDVILKHFKPRSY